MAKKKIRITRRPRKQAADSVRRQPQLCTTAEGYRDLHALTEKVRAIVETNGGPAKQVSYAMVSAKAFRQGDAESIAAEVMAPAKAKREIQRELGEEAAAAIHGRKGESG